jgi:hypothetical protein
VAVVAAVGVVGSHIGFVPAVVDAIVVVAAVGFDTESVVAVALVDSVSAATLVVSIAAVEAFVVAAVTGPGIDSVVVVVVVVDSDADVVPELDFPNILDLVYHGD